MVEPAVEFCSRGTTYRAVPFLHMSKHQDEMQDWSHDLQGLLTKISS